MENVYVEREVHVIKPADFHNDFLYPEKLMVQFDPSVKAKPYDIGALCFVKREAILPGWDAGKTVKPRKVMIQSFQKKRRTLISKVIDHFYISGNRDSSNFNRLRYLQTFVDWADLNNCSDFLENESCMIFAYQKYTDHLYHLMLESEEIKPESARQMQSGVHFLFKVYYPEAETELIATTNIIEFVRANNSAPSEEHVQKYLSTMVPLARNLRLAVMKDDFPLTVECGGYDAILLPCNLMSVFSPYSSRVHSMFNKEAKRYFTLDEYLGVRVGKSKDKIERNSFSPSRKDYIKTMGLLDFGNKNKHDCFYRCVWAQKVIRLYAKLIQILTGANSSDLTRLEYSNSIDVTSDGIKKELVTVKFRASGMKVSYPVHRKGVRLLQEYIEFRDWYLNGKKVDLLFFTDIASSGKRTEPLPLRADFDSRLFKQLSGRVICPSIKNISPTRARKFKSIMLKNFGLSRRETAVALNHSEKTNEYHYSKPSKSKMKEELAEYWNAVKETAVSLRIVAPEGESNNGARKITVGHCEDYGHPLSNLNTPSIEPNCKKQFGCLYCEHYFLHADKEDIHKLFCLSYVVKSVRENIAEFREADEFFRDLCIRVEYIVEEVSRRFPEVKTMITEVKYQVFELGILTPFWEDRLSRYERLGIVL